MWDHDRDNIAVYETLMTATQPPSRPRRRLGIGMRYVLAAMVAPLAAMSAIVSPAFGQQDPLQIHSLETVWQGPGITAQIAQLSRPNVRHSGRLLIALLDPGSFTAAITDTVPDYDAGQGPRWQLAVDGTFFDENERPIYLLQQGSQVYGPFRNGTSAVFWCRAGTCAITHTRDYDAYRQIDIAVQSSPRVFANGAPTAGVRGPNRMSSRAGLAITRSGQVAVFATDRWPWQGLTFNEVAELVAPMIDATDILMLDGGSSVVFQLDGPGFSLSSRGSGRSVPYLISFTGPP